MTNDESSAYYNKESGEVVWAFEYMDNDTELLDDIEDKSHIGVDKDSGLVHHLEVTPANEPRCNCNIQTNAR